MTPATLVTEEDARQLLRAYNLRLRALFPIPRGTINSNYWVQTDAGPAFLRINEGKSEADARFESELIWHLGSRGLPTPQLWRTRASEPYLMWRRERTAVAQPVMLFTWVQGQELGEAELTAEHAFAVGALLGQLHLCTADFPPCRPGIYTLARIKDRLRRLARDARAVEAAGPLLATLSREADALATTRYRHLPSGIGHCDLFPDNLLFTRQRVAHRPPAEQTRPGSGAAGLSAWILDLEQAAFIPLVYDVAVVLLSFAVPPANLALIESAAEATAAPPPTVGPLDAARARALLDGYQTMRPLNDHEWNALAAELRWAAVRFTTTRLTDIEGFGGLRPPRPASAADPTPATAPQAKRSRYRPPAAPPPHSKDYRDFARRLALLQPLSADDLQKSLR